MNYNRGVTESNNNTMAMKKKINAVEFAQGECICFRCRDVNTCVHRSRYYTDCGHYDPA